MAHNQNYSEEDLLREERNRRAVEAGNKSGQKKGKANGDEQYRSMNNQSLPSIGLAGS
jgi:hypothetical protein